MSYLTSKMRGLSAVLAAMCTMGLVSTADAKLSTKIWDPAYDARDSSPLPDLGWSGKVTFDIKDDCLATIKYDQWIDNLGLGACAGKLSIKSAVVTLYDIVDGNNGAAADVTLSYGSGIFYGGNAPLTLRMYVDVEGTEKTLKAVQGGFLFPEFTSASFAKVVGYDAAAYWLSFNENRENSFYPLSNEAPQGDYAFLTGCSYRKGSSPEANETYDHYKSTHLDVACSQNDGINSPAILRPIPEPETYMLALASFGVLGVWARRRRPSSR